jgi:WD40 repeat protein
MDSTARIWDIASQQYHRVLDQLDDWWVMDFAFSPDSRFIAAMNNDPAIYVYNCRLRPPRPDHPAADFSRERIQRLPVPGGLINEYERAA